MKINHHCTNHKIAKLKMILKLNPRKNKLINNFDDTSKNISLKYT